MKRMWLKLFLLISFCFPQDVLITISGNRVEGKFIEVTPKYVLFQRAGIKMPSKVPSESVMKVVLENGDLAYNYEEEVSDEFKEKYKKTRKEAELRASYHGNKLSKKYHLGTVSHLPKEINRKLFSSPKEAKESGFHPCPACFDLRPNLADYQLEKQLVIGVNASIRNRYEIIYEHPKFNQLKSILEKLLSQWTETLKGYDYRILIAKDEDPNAFAVAGGNIYLTTGLLDMIEDESELEFIISHEITHIEKRHTLRQFKETQRRKSSAVLTAIIVGAGVAAAGGEVEDVLIAAGLTAAVSDFSNQFALRGFSREMEQESDIFAQLQLSQMGIKREEMIYSLDKLATNSSKLGYNITANSFSDHPALKARISQVLNSELVRLDKPLNIYIVDNNTSGDVIEENFLLNITTRVLYKGPSSNKKDEDVITIIGSITNNNFSDNYQIEDIKFHSFSINNNLPFVGSGLNGLVININSTVDFASTINVKRDVSSALLASFKDKNIRTSIKVSEVRIKSGKGGKRVWDKKPINIITYIK